MTYTELLEARIEALAEVLQDARRGLVGSRAICVRAAQGFGMADADVTEIVAEYDAMLARIDRALEGK